MALILSGSQSVADKVVEMHRRLAGFVRVGMTTIDIEKFVIASLDDLKCKSAFYLYQRDRKKFPSHACYSINNVIVHGTAVSWGRPLRDGDLLKIDIGIRYQGSIGDAAWTYAVGSISEEAQRLLSCAKKAMDAGLKMVRYNCLVKDWAHAAHASVMKDGFHMVEGLGGHGISAKLHDLPYISNRADDIDWSESRFQAGTVVAVEPMISAGTSKTKHKVGQWPIETADGSLSVHLEHDLFIRESDTVVLTKGLEELPEVLK